MTFYDTLGVAPDASAAMIKAAWRTLAQRNHPDKKDGSTEKYQEIQRAYDVLSDPVKRAHYDATGEVGNDGPSLRTQALQVISDVISGAIDAVDVDFEDILAHTERSIKHTLEKVEALEAEYARRRAKVVSAIKRTKAKAGNTDSLAMILAHLDAQIAGPLAAIANDKAKMTLAIDILTEHEYAVDARPAGSQFSQNDEFMKALMGFSQSTIKKNQKFGPGGWL